MTEAHAGDPLGYDVAAIEPWLAEHIGDLVRPLVWKKLEGGHSNLTCLLEDAKGAKAVIRRAPLGELQPRAHDMAREFRVISALWPTPVPVARPYAVCLDTAITGSVFYVMGYVPGHSGSTDWLVTPEQRSTVSESFIDAMASLHLLDVDEIGIGDLASHQDYVGRQLRSWYRSWTSNAEATGVDDPRVHEIHDWLQAHAPEQGSPRLVHGDYGFHNLIVGDDARIAAVVDWEVCTFGPPLADLAFVLNRWAPGGHAALPENFWSSEQLVARYQERTGADLDGLDFYLAFNGWRSACIQQGVYTRYVRGQKAADGVDVEGFRRSFEGRLALAESIIATLS
jgi:aminoglycoside phosphotransferase (APT) family kinase protein